MVARERERNSMYLHLYLSPTFKIADYEWSEYSKGIVEMAYNNQK